MIRQEIRAAASEMRWYRRQYGIILLLTKHPRCGTRSILHHLPDEYIEKIVRYASRPILTLDEECSSCEDVMTGVPRICVATKVSVCYLNKLKPIITAEVRESGNRVIIFESTNDTRDSSRLIVGLDYDIHRTLHAPLSAISDSSVKAPWSTYDYIIRIGNYFISSSAITGGLKMLPWTTIHGGSAIVNVKDDSRILEYGFFPFIPIYQTTKVHVIHRLDMEEHMVLDTILKLISPIERIIVNFLIGEGALHRWLDILADKENRLQSKGRILTEVFERISTPCISSILAENGLL